MQQPKSWYKTDVHYRSPKPIRKSRRAPQPANLFHEHEYNDCVSGGVPPHTSTSKYAH